MRQSPEMFVGCRSRPAQLAIARGLGHSITDKQILPLSVASVRESQGVRSQARCAHSSESSGGC